MAAMTPIEINYELLRRLARYTYTPAEIEEVEKLMVHPDLDWSLFLGACFKQKIAGLVAFNFNRWRLTDKGLFRIHIALKLFYLANQERNKRLLEMLNTTTDALHAHGVDARPLKGSILVPLIYKDLGSRLLSDFDFFAPRSQKGEIVKAMSHIGFTTGVYEAKQNEIRPLSREEQLVWQLKMFSMPEFIKNSNDDYTGILSADFSFGLQYGESQDQSERVLARSAVIGGRKTLSVYDFFIQVCCHLYKEASNEAWVEYGLDINIVKFCDVREFTLVMLSISDLSELRDRILELGVEQAVYFSVYYAFELYGDALLAEIVEILSKDVASKDFMTDIYRQGTRAVGTREKSIVDAIGGL
jgi:hypothetical protein